jgi:glycogen debranching enzyme
MSIAALHPNRENDAGEVPEYNTVDATLWYFEAIRSYYDATADDDLLAELFPVLADIIDWHCRGTRYNIHLDARDGLLSAGASGVQLTLPYHYQASARRVMYRS